MTYPLFLVIFLIAPILALVVMARRKLARREALIPPLVSLIALIYTTPWDNYLVAERVWWYDPSRVAGITLGWVPLEEYLFFVLQPLLTGWWFLAFAPEEHLAAPARPALRWAGVLGVGTVWLGALGVLSAGWRAGRYLALELAWFLPPIMLQLGFGADHLWRRRRAILVGLLPALTYYSAADALAIAQGTWTISPRDSLGILLGGVLPLEEFIFFLLTNVLIVSSVELAAAPASLARLRDVRGQAQAWLHVHVHVF